LSYPKGKMPKLASDFWPISLCNVISKIILKTIANRLKLILPDIIGKYQSAFVPGRLITDNALLAFESFHWMRKKRRERMDVLVLNWTWQKHMIELNGISLLLC